MVRVNKLLEHVDFIHYMKKIDGLEKERRFCKHGYEHAINVARIAYIYMLEIGLNDLAKEGIYAAALLHDIGRWVEYETGEDHAEASARLALPLLEDCSFAPEDIKKIIKGIREHRLHHKKNLTLLGEVLALADDWARDCRACAVQTQCYKFNPAMSLVTY